MEGISRVSWSDSDACFRPEADICYEKRSKSLALDDACPSSDSLAASNSQPREGVVVRLGAWVNPSGARGWLGSDPSW